MISARHSIFGWAFAAVLAWGGGSLGAGVTPVEQFLAPAEVQWSGLLGQAIADSSEKRLKHFIQDEHSVPIALFSPEGAAGNTTGRYWGEHAGKWLFAASRAAARTGDAELAARVRHIADYLVSTQGPDGYIGTYPEEFRFMRRQNELTRGRWDVWVSAYVLQGLLEVNRHFPDRRYVDASRRLADLCWRTFVQDKADITQLSNLMGLSATIIVEPLADLYALTGEPRYLELCKNILQQADRKPGFELEPKALAGADVQTIATGKAYQLGWQFFGLARLYRATGDTAYLKMAQNAAENIRKYHLTLGGGPWGGVGVGRELFDPQDFFSPYGYVETCSIMAWIQLNRELLGLTGQPRYADEIERAAYNALLGAQDANGEDWCYYTFANGQRVNTSEMKCCKSSGALALEELGPVTYAVRAGRDLVVNLFGPNQGSVELAGAGRVAVRQETNYPADGRVQLTISPAKAAEFVVAIRIPAWAEGASLAVNGQPVSLPVTPGSYAEVRRTWQAGDTLTANFPMHPVVHRSVNKSEQDTNLRRGDERIMQTVMRYDYLAITRGPLVYSTGLIDGFKQAETLRVPDQPEVEEIPATVPGAAPAIRLALGYRAPLVFTPYYAEGGRHDLGWRLTWMQVVSEEKK